MLQGLRKALRFWGGSVSKNYSQKKMEMEKILLLPANTTESIDAFFHLKNETNTIIGVSSVSLSSSVNLFDEYFKIPWITEDNFCQAIIELVQKNKVTKIVCTHLGIYKKLKDKIPKEILISKPEEINFYGINKSGMQTRAVMHYQELQSAKEKLTYTEFESLFNYFNQIPGNCSEEKFTALIDAAASAPQGDYIEIGSFYGKSALAIGWLAKINESKLLCIDPWEINEIPQSEAHSSINLTYSNLSISKIKSIFIANLYLPLKGHINYLQSYSDAAFEEYKKNTIIQSKEFGKISYKNKIAFLHIDGNHDYIYAKSDITKWSKYLLSGGWMVIDDYNWCYGDGPTKAADEFVIENLENIEQCFYCGGALFINMKKI